MWGNSMADARSLLGLQKQSSFSVMQDVSLECLGALFLARKKRRPRIEGDIEGAKAGNTVSMTWLEHLDPAKPEGRFHLRTFQIFWPMTSLSPLEPTGAGWPEARHRMSE